MLEIRQFIPDEWQTYRDLRLQSLSESPDAFGRTFAEEDSRTDSEWIDRFSSGCESETDLPLVAEFEGQPIGLAWGRFPEPEDRATAHLFQMWVHPGFRGRGAGSTLVHGIIKWAEDMGASFLLLGVTCGSPASRLYGRAGFEPSGDPEPLRPGSSLLAQPMELKLNRNAA